MRHVLRMDAAAGVAHSDLDNRREFLPLDLYCVSFLCVVKGILYDIADCFGDPAAVAQQFNTVITAKGQRLLFMLGTICIVSFYIPHHIG